MNSEQMTFLGVGALLVLWTGLVVTHNTNPDLIDAIKACMGALGVWHVGANLQRAPQQLRQGGGASANSDLTAEKEKQ